MACPALRWHNPGVSGCSECLALKANYIDRITDFIELSRRHNGSNIEPAVRQAEVAIEKAWNELSKHRKIHVGTGPGGHSLRA